MSLKSKLIELCPDFIFALLWNDFKSTETGITISDDDKGWVILGQGFSLLSPTAKFTSVSMNQFENKFEKFFKIDSNDICIDVGSCIGDTTLPMLLKTKNTVYAIEPNKLNFKYLEKNTEKYKNCINIQKAMWKEKGQLTFHEHSSPTGHSLIPVSSRKKESIVECDTLDNTFKGIVIDFAKIDVQDAEVEVLQGAGQFLKTTRKLVVECHHAYKKETRNTAQEVQSIISKYYAKMAFSNEYNLWYAWR